MGPDEINAGRHDRILVESLLAVRSGGDEEQSHRGEYEPSTLHPRWLL